MEMEWKLVASFAMDELRFLSCSQRWTTSCETKRDENAEMQLLDVADGCMVDSKRPERVETRPH